MNFRLVSNIYLLVLLLTDIVNPFLSYKTSIKLYTYGTNPEMLIEYNVWKYAPNRDSGNGLSDQGDYLIAQGRSDENGKVIWNNTSEVLDLTDYGTGIFGINEVFIDEVRIEDSNWTKWDERTYYRTFTVSEDNTYLELVCVNVIDNTPNTESEEADTIDSTEEGTLVEYHPIEVESINEKEEVTSQVTEAIYPETDDVRMSDEDINETKILEITESVQNPIPTEESVMPKTQSNQRMSQAISILSILASVAVLYFAIAVRKSK